jgi:hypothetical protein
MSGKTRTIKVTPEKRAQALRDAARNSKTTIVSTRSGQFRSKATSPKSA